MGGYHTTQQDKDRREAKKLAAEKALTDLENETYKKTVTAIESKIEKYDIEIKELTKHLHEPQFHSSLDLKVKRRRRKFLKKSRKNLVIQLDLLRK